MKLEMNAKVSVCAWHWIVVCIQRMESERKFLVHHRSFLSASNAIAPRLCNSISNSNSIRPTSNCLTVHDNMKRIPNEHSTMVALWIESAPSSGCGKVAHSVGSVTVVCNISCVIGGASYIDLDMISAHMASVAETICS